MSPIDTPQARRPNTFLPERELDARCDGIRELDQRTTDGITVTLLWNAGTNRVFISVVEQRLGVSFDFAVTAAEAADAFRHPYAYAAPNQEGDAPAA
jgi:hypothetical protein